MASSSPSRNAQERLYKLEKLSTSQGFAIGEYAALHGNFPASIFFEVSKDKVKYWKRKFNNPWWHRERHGGPRNRPFSDEEILQVCATIREISDANPLTSYQQYCNQILERHGIAVSPSMVRMVFVANGYSWQVPTHKQMYKYTTENLLRYAEYLAWVAEIDPTRVKFLDECHFSPKDYRPKRAIAPIGSPRIFVHSGTLPKPCSITLTTSLSGNVAEEGLFMFDVRYVPNTQEYFLEYIRAIADSGFLKFGDILVMDNSRVHTGRTLWNDIIAALEAVGVTLMLLPSYSPELNPCELVFGAVKRYMRRQPPAIYHETERALMDQRFLTLLRESLETISEEQLTNMYSRCRDPSNM